MNEHLLQALDKGVRYDGRKLDEYREIKIETGVSKSAEGSALITAGKTKVIVGVKLGVEKPYDDTPEEGNLMVNVELLPLSNDKYEIGPPQPQAIELSRVTDRGLRESKAIDPKKLCITKGELVWNVMVDACTINDDGGLFDIIGLGALAALKNARFPKIEDNLVKYDEMTEEKIPLSREPIPVTVFKIGKHLVLDPLPEEENAADARLTVTVTGENTVCALQKGGFYPLTAESIDSMIALALEKAPELRKKL